GRQQSSASSRGKQAGRIGYRDDFLSPDTRGSCRAATRGLGRPYIVHKQTLACCGSRVMEPYWTIEEICTAIARNAEQWAAVRDGQSFVPLLAFLEHPYSVVDARLVEGLVAAGLPRSEAERVSLRDLVIFALTGPLKWGWGAHAVSWIEAGF